MKNGKKPEDEKIVLEKLNEKLVELSNNMERMRLAEYVEMFAKPKRLFYVNFLIGLARGFGSAIGFTILAALVIYILQKVILFNIPIIGEFIADIVLIVQNQMNVGGH
ncbi:MAG: hypothetical protein GX333_07465 [Syntrophomonadaceae bacterium]|mgnify:CR=1 FL=1|nr:hypothetical protein [Syntrophomonadaceae bacterium]